MLRIGIDIDDCIVNTTQAVLTQHYENTGEKLSLEDIKSYCIEDYVSPEYREDFHKIFLNKNVWKRVELLPDCVDVVGELHNAGYEIWIITSTSPENVLKKCNFLDRTFPFLDIRKHLIITPCKQMIDVDILIDDAVHNVVNAGYSSILFDYPWNRDMNEKSNPNIYRVSGWNEVLKTVKLIQRRITNE